MKLPDQDDLIVLDALAEAQKLYARYLELARLGEISARGVLPADAEADELLPAPGWDHPLGLVIDR